jgi:hypothetical protein
MNGCVSGSRGLMALLCASFAVCSAFSQEKSSQPDLTVKKLINPYLLGLDSTASVSTAGYPGSFYLGEGSGGKQIRIEIIPKPVKIGNERRLRELLEENGIRSEPNALSYVYYLNPDLPSIHDVSPGTTLQLPELHIPEFGSDRALPRQPIIELAMDAKLKESLNGDIDDFRSTLNKKTRHFAPSVQDDLKAIDLALDPIYRDKLPTSHDMLAQVRSDVIRLEAILGNYSHKFNLFQIIFFRHPKFNVSSEDSVQLKLFRTDLLAKVDASKRGNPNVTVKVRTFKGEVEISHLIVCYSPEARYKKENQCELSFPERTPTEYPLPVATYMFWAIRPGYMKPVSDTRRMQVQWLDGQPFKLDLTIVE